MTKQQYFDAVAKELEQQHLDRGLWARAFAETNGDKERARALYIRLRVAQLEQDAQATSPPTNAQEDSPLAKPKRNILKIVLSCIGIALMMAVVKECNRPPKVAVANDAQQVASLIGSYQNVSSVPNPPNADLPMRVVETYYANGACDQYARVESGRTPNSGATAHYVYRVDGETLTLGNVDSANHFYPDKELQPRKVIRDSSGRVVKLYIPSKDLVFDRIN